MPEPAFVEEHNRLLALNVKCVGGGAWIPTCCIEEHAICHFAAASLYCVVQDCQNPHHTGP